MTSRDGYCWTPQGGLKSGIPTIGLISPSTNISSQDVVYDVVVVGAGYCGLTAARNASLEGLKVLLLEGRDRIGGRSWSSNIGDYPFDMGGTWDELLASALNKFTNIDGVYGRKTIHLPHDTFRTPLALALDKLSAQEGINDIASTLSPQERTGLEANILLASGGTLETTSFHEFMHWWAMCGYTYQGWLDMLITWKFKRGQSSFAIQFFQEALSTKRLSYAFNTPVKHIHDTGSQIKVTTRDGRNFRALRAISAIPLNVLSDVSFDPPLSAGKHSAMKIGNINQTVKVHAELSNKNLRSWTGITFPHNELPYAIADGTTPAGNTHVMCFGGQNNHMHPEADIARTQRAVSSLFMPSHYSNEAPRIQRLVFHNWSNDEFAKGAWFFPPPGLLVAHLDDMRAAWERPRLSGLKSVDTTTHAGQVQNVPPALIGLAVRSEEARDMSGLEIVSAGFAATFALAISQGGPSTLLYGPIVMFVVVGACASTLAELASVYPTAGGQYHWISILAPEGWSRGISYCCGAINVFTWIAIAAGVAIIVPQLALGIAVFWYPNYAVETWHAFLLYQGSNALIVLYNIYLLRRTMWVHDFAFFLSLVSFLVVVVTCLARTGPTFQPTKAVWDTFLNESGWTDGIAFLTGLVSPNYMYAGIDGAMHLAEECKNAAVVVPRALVSTISIGFVTSFVFAMSMLYCTSDIDAAVTTKTGVPVYEIWRQATRSNAAATVFLVLLLLAAILLNATHQTASKLTCSFARDDALFGSQWLSKIDPKQRVPVVALLFNFAIMFIIGCIYLGSSSAFNAFIGTGLILQHVTYAFPAALLLYRGRSSTWLPASRYFKMPSIIGWAANLTTVAFAILVLIFYDLPTSLPASGNSMDYTSAVIGVMAVFMALNWFLFARKHYSDPRLQVFEE